MKKNIILIASAIWAVSAFADYENYDGQVVNSIDFYLRSLNNSSWIGATLRFVYFCENTTLINANFTNADLRSVGFVDYYNRDDKIIAIGANFTNATLESVFFGGNRASSNLTNANFTNVKAVSSVTFGGDLTNTNFTNADLTGASFSRADLRGADMDSLKGVPYDYRLTIMPDGVIEGWYMGSYTEFLIRKYTPVTPSGDMISAKLKNSASITGGAQMVLEQGAELEILENASLIVGANSQIKINTDAENSTSLAVNENAALSFDDGAILSINVIGDINANGAYTFKVLEWAESSVVQGLENLIKGVSLLFTVNGEAFAGEWDAVFGDGYFAVAVPEPAEFAAMFGMLALAFAAYRRRK